MFLVKQSFALGEISATKGKVINLKDKKLIEKLKSANLITDFSEKELSSKELQKRVDELEKENTELKGKIEKLEEALASSNNSDNEATPDNGESDSDDKTTETETDVTPDNKNANENSENSDNE